MNSLRRNTIWAFVADGLQLVLGLVALTLLLGALGREEFGYYSTIIAMATFAVPVMALGAQQVLMKDMADGVDFDDAWPKSVSRVVLGGLVSTPLAAVTVRPWIMPEIPVWTFVLLFASQAMGYAVAEFCLVSAQAHRRLAVASVIRLTSGTLRVGAVALFAAGDGSTVDEWSRYAITVWVVAALANITTVRVAFGSWPFGTPPGLADLRRGAPFALGAGSAYALDAADRPMLLAIAGPAESGLYAAGYRLVQMGLAPVMALLRASDADFFEVGKRGLGEVTKLATSLTRVAAAYAAVLGLVLAVGAPLVPMVLGDEEYGGTENVIRLLAVFPLLKSVQSFPANALTGLGLQSWRNGALGIALVVNIVANLLLIPRHGWVGAAVSTLIGESVMGLVLWGSLRLVAPRRLSAGQTR